MSGKNLRQIVEQFSSAKVLVVGDLILDKYIWGKVERISPEAPVAVVNVNKEEERLGGAGNVAHNIRALGAEVSLCGVVGDDSDGRRVVEMLEAQGIDCQGVMVDRSRPTTVKTRVVAHSQQIVRIDKESTVKVAPAFSHGLAAAISDHAKRVGAIVLSDYGKGTVTDTLIESLRSSESVELLRYGKAPLVVDPKAPNFDMYRGATVVKPNCKEASQASGLEISSRADAIAAGKVLLEKWQSQMVLVTLGEGGMVLVSNIEGHEDAYEIDTEAQEVFDVSGAGDTVAAVFALALAARATPEQAARVANIAAGIVVAEVGTAVVNAAELTGRLPA